MLANLSVLAVESWMEKWMGRERGEREGRAGRWTILGRYPVFGRKGEMDVIGTILCQLVLSGSAVDGSDRRIYL